MVGCAGFSRLGGAATTLPKGISLATVQKILGSDRPQTTAIDLNFTDTHVHEEFERKW
jgi:integrase/recombinase XerD